MEKLETSLTITSGYYQDDFNDFMDVRLQVVDKRIKSTYYEILTELFETGTSEGSVEVDTLTERVDFDGYSQAVRRRRIARGFEPLRKDLNKS